MKDANNYCGIDYGAKLAGTSAIAYFVGNKKLRVETTLKGEDADAFLFEKVLKIKANTVFIDAPLSLPGIYSNQIGYTDYFYRQCDRELKAMSPMFLGGLTARAICLKDRLFAQGVICRESYPAYQAKKLQLHELGYKKEKAAIAIGVKLIEEKYSLQTQGINNWHAFDAFLALLAGIHFENNEGEIIGNNEGYVYV